MKNKTITIYELMGLIKDNKAPKKIKIYDETYELLDVKSDYISKDKNTCLSTELQKLFKYNYLTTVLQTKIEIIPEENDEWEDIEEYQYSIIPSYFDLKSAIKTINENFEKHQKALESIIKNQKYLKAMVESLQRPFTDEIRVDIPKWIEDPKKRKVGE